mmetsp:Transcript_30329/g.51677  ORF Transcript_30329/g.51677 Transcript_30329/m.51677 type:complete len:207 (-) Transcript_30329:346-966(-)
MVSTFFLGIRSMEKVAIHTGGITNDRHVDWSRSERFNRQMDAIRRRLCHTVIGRVDIPRNGEKRNRGASTGINVLVNLVVDGLVRWSLRKKNDRFETATAIIEAPFHPFIINGCGVDVGFTGNIVQTKDGNVICFEVEKLRIYIPTSIGCSFAMKGRRVTSRERRAKLIERRIQSKVLAPQISEVAIIGTRVVAIAFVPFIVSGYD